MKLKHFSYIMVVAALLAGCFSTEQPPAPTGKKDTAANDTTRLKYVLDSIRMAKSIDSLKFVNDSLLLCRQIDSLKLAGKDTTRIKVPGNNGGWDDFPNKYKPTLLELASGAQALPVPMGTRYGATPTVKPAGKFAANQDPCPRGPFEVYGYKEPVRDFFIVDTLSYYDSAGGVHCSPTYGSTGSEHHIRYIMDLKSGESWENLVDTITDQNVLPRHTIHGTGKIKLASGLEFTIVTYDVVLITQFGTWDAFVLRAGMTLAYKGGYTVDLKLVKPSPYKAVDFFPVEGGVGDGSKMMSGPITKVNATGGVDTIGFVDLFSDRTVAVRDWKGDPVAP